LATLTLLVELHDAESHTAMCVHIHTVATERCFMDGGDEGARNFPLSARVFFSSTPVNQHKTVPSQGYGV